MECSVSDSCYSRIYYPWNDRDNPGNTQLIFQSQTLTTQDIGSCPHTVDSLVINQCLSEDWHNIASALSTSLVKHLAVWGYQLPDGFYRQLCKFSKLLSLHLRTRTPDS